MQQESNYLSILPFLPYAKLLGSLLSWKYGEDKEISLLVLQSICWNYTVDDNDEEDHVLFDLSGRECNLKFRTFETFHSDVTADRNQFQIRPKIKLLIDWTHISGSFVIMSTLWRRTLQKKGEIARIKEQKIIICIVDLQLHSIKISVMKLSQAVQTDWLWKKAF